LFLSLLCNFTFVFNMTTNFLYTVYIYIYQHLSHSYFS
jgi:hypothetical protein